MSKIKNIKNLLYNKKEINNIYYENGLIFALSIKDIYNNYDERIKHISLPYDNVIQLEYPLYEKIVDIDTLEDFNEVEFLIKNKINRINKREFKINNRVINSETKPFVIAEIGINHNSDINKAVKMIYDAWSCGCECVKFQCHIANEEMTNDAKKIIPSNADEDIFEIINKNFLQKKKKYI